MRGFLWKLGQSFLAEARKASRKQRLSDEGEKGLKWAYLSLAKKAVS